MTLHKLHIFGVNMCLLNAHICVICLSAFFFFISDGRVSGWSGLACQCLSYVSYIVSRSLCQLYFFEIVNCISFSLSTRFPQVQYISWSSAFALIPIILSSLGIILTGITLAGSVIIIMKIVFIINKISSFCHQYHHIQDHHEYHNYRPNHSDYYNYHKLSS